MNRCRLCNTNLKPYQIYCPKCGAKLPILDKDELKDFRDFKKKFRPLFALFVIIIIIIFVLFFIKVPYTEVTEYKVGETLTESQLVDKGEECNKEDFVYEVLSVDANVYKEILEVSCEIKNYEDKWGLFRYNLTLNHKITLNDTIREGQIIIGAGENKTVNDFFADIQERDDYDIFCFVEPPEKEVCDDGIEQEIVVTEQEVIKEKKELKDISLFERLFLRN